MRLIATVLLLAPVAAVSLPASAYVLALTALAPLGLRKRQARACGSGQRFAVLVPAHDEETVLPRALQSLAALDYPRDLVDVWVVADNCTDATAELARRHGAETRERCDATLIGKGHALQWLLGEIAASGRVYDAFVVVDADSVLSANFLTEMATALNAGARVAQGYYTVLPLRGTRAEALRGAALALVHHLRPLAKEAFGGSCGLKGNGMCFDRALLERFGWPSAGLAEDVEFHLRLVAAGFRVAFVPRAVVYGEMPATLREAGTQNERWEAGRLATVRRLALPLLWRGLRRRSPAMVDAAVEQLMPPLSVPVAVALLCGAGGLLLGLPLVWLTAAASLAAVGIYVVVGLALARASAAEWRALLAAPIYVAWKALVYARSVRPREREWQRTGRVLVTETRSAD